MKKIAVLLAVVILVCSGCHSVQSSTEDSLVTESTTTTVNTLFDETTIDMSSLTTTTTPQTVTTLNTTTTKQATTTKKKTTLPTHTTSTKRISTTPKPITTTKNFYTTQQFITTASITTATQQTIASKTSATIKKTTTCSHAFSNASCTEPKSCWKCGFVESPALGHIWEEATCTKAQRCSRCYKVVGTALGHKYVNGTCSRCGEYDVNYMPTFSMGETWVVDGQWEFTIDSVTTHYLCNDSSNERWNLTNEQAIIITYSYKNIGYSNSSYGLSFNQAWFDVYDEEGEPANPFYSCQHKTGYSKECIIGTKCTGAQQIYILNNPSSKIIFKVHHSGPRAALFHLNID